MSKLEDIVYEILVDHSLNTDQKGEALVEYFSDLLEQFKDTSECWYDHHGYCQGHDWMATEPQCPQKTLKELLS